MRVPKRWQRRKTSCQLSVASCQLLGIVAVIAMALLAGCSINEQKSADNKDKKVEIKTPFGELKVNTDVDPRDTGLPVYPGARRAPRDEHDSNAANVNISTGAFGLKVVAVKFESDDPPNKILSFYRDKVKAYGGTYLECRGFDIDIHGDYKNDDSKELTCGKGDRRGDSTELKAGTPDRQHIVSVKPNGSGSEFALVYVNKRGKEGEI